MKNFQLAIYKRDASRHTSRFRSTICISANPTRPEKNVTARTTFGNCFGFDATDAKLFIELWVEPYTKVNAFTTLVIESDMLLDCAVIFPPGSLQLLCFECACGWWRSFFVLYYLLDIRPTSHIAHRASVLACSAEATSDRNYTPGISPS